MRTILTILLLLPFAVYSQSIHVDGPTGRVSDLDAVIMPAATDLVVIEHADSSKKITFGNFTSVPHGSFAFHDSATTLTMSTNVWSKITNAWNTLFTVVDADFMVFAGDSITLTYGGDYFSIASISFSGTAGDNYE